MRLYVLVLSINPIRLYLFDEGMARFSTDPYEKPNKQNMSNLFMHLTNYSINAKNKGKFVFNKNIEDTDEGHKRSYSSILDHIATNFEDGD